MASVVVFEPSYIWNRDEEKNESKSLFARFLSKKKENGPEIFKKSFHGNGKYEKLDDGAELKTLKAADLDDKSILLILKWENESKNVEKRFVAGKEAEAEQFLSDLLQKANYRVGELVLEMRKFRFDSNKSRITAGKVSLRMENLALLEWWIQKIDVEKLVEMNIAPFGQTPLDIPHGIFDLPQFHQCRVLRITEHCSFSPAQLLALCSSTPHFSFYSNTIPESVGKSAIEASHLANNWANSSIVQKCQEQKDFVVLEWFFSGRVDTQKVIKDLVRPKGERKERLNVQTQSFDPVEVFSVSNENDRKVSLMIVEDVATFRPYSIVLYA